MLRQARTVPGTIGVDLRGRPRGDMARSLPSSRVDTWLAPTFNPLTAITWAAVYWAGDPMWTAPADGAAVDQWDDASGNVRHVTASSTARPTLALNGINGRPALLFDGSNDALVCAAAQWGTALAAPRSFVAVAKSSTASGDHSLVDSANGAPGSTVFINSGTNWAAFYASAGSAVTGGTPDTSPHLFRSVNQGGSNGTNVAVDETVYTLNTAGGTATLPSLSIGMSRFATAPWSGHIAFLAVYAGDVTTDAQWGNFKAWARQHYALGTVL